MKLSTLAIIVVVLNIVYAIISSIPHPIMLNAVFGWTVALIHYMGYLNEKKKNENLISANKNRSGS